MDSTGPFALNFGSILAALVGPYDVVASFIVLAPRNVLDLIWIGRGVAAIDPDPHLYLTAGLILTTKNRSEKFVLSCTVKFNAPELIHSTTTCRS